MKRIIRVLTDLKQLPATNHTDLNRRYKVGDRIGRAMTTNELHSLADDIRSKFPLLASALKYPDLSFAFTGDSVREVEYTNDVVFVIDNVGTDYSYR